MFLNNHIYCKIQKILLCNFFYIKQIPKLCKSCFCWNCLYSFSLYWLTDEYIWGAFCFTSRIHIMHRLFAHSFKWSHLRLWRLMAGLEEGGWGWPRAPDWLLTLMFVCRSRSLRERERERERHQHQVAPARRNEVSRTTEATHRAEIQSRWTMTTWMAMITNSPFFGSWV